MQSIQNCGIRCAIGGGPVPVLKWSLAAALLMAAVARASDGVKVMAVGQAEPVKSTQAYSEITRGSAAVAGLPGLTFPPGYGPAQAVPIAQPETPATMAVTPATMPTPPAEALTPQPIATPAAAAPAVPATTLAAPAAATPAITPSTTAAPTEAASPAPLVEGDSMRVGKFSIQFDGADSKELVKIRPGLAIDRIMNAPITLAWENGEVGTFLVPVPAAKASAAASLPAAYSAKTRPVVTSLADLPTLRTRLRPEAVASAEEQLVLYLHSQGLYGVWVAPDDKAMAASKTAEGVADFPFVIHVVRVTSVGGKGSQSVAEGSPIQPSGKGSGILMKDDLDNYLLRLNRVPARRVDVAVAANIKEGDNGVEGLALDYLVTNQKPWLIFSQISNTGTKNTEIWRERFGLVDNNLTGHNDILTVDYTTAGFDEVSNSIAVSYETPIMKQANPTRVRMYASYGNFVASDVGLAALRFRGDETMVGGEVIQPLLQINELFLDGVVGFRYEHERVDNEGIAKGTGDFSQPYVGLRLERTTPEVTMAGGVDLIASFGTANQASLDNLGRLQADRNTIMLQAHGSVSFFLEPIFDGPNYAAHKSTLAHEIFFSGKLQDAFDYRMIPSMEDVVGGLYSVRGYPESVAAGDSIAIGTAEYRLHIPRLFAESKAGQDVFGKPFRYVPGIGGSRPDWDLVAKGFVDVGQTFLNNKIAGEADQSLVGTGIGMDLVYKQYFSVRADWGVAIQGIDDAGSGEHVSPGSNRFHLVFTFSY